MLGVLSLPDFAYGELQIPVESEVEKKQILEKLDRRAIELEKPIKSEGEHEVVIKVHPQVEATLKVVVKENA